MKPKWQKLASLVQEICTLWFQFFVAVFASRGYPFKSIFKVISFIIILVEIMPFVMDRSKSKKGALILEGFALFN